MKTAGGAPRWAVLLVVLFSLTVGAEGVCRWMLGLGTPPLYETDPAYEYRLKPDQKIQRFGNTIMVNRFGMRSDDFPSRKQQPDELRVMVFGDSIVNGGSEVDHAGLATSLLQSDLRRSIKHPVMVGNVSAGSWGPGNWLAYAQRFGFFDADVVVLVLGSGDARDNPDFAPLSVNHPTEPPVLALQEAVQRYLPRHLPEPLAGWLRGPTSASATPAAAKQASDPTLQGLQDLERFLRLAHDGKRAVVVLHHPSRNETDTAQMEPGFEDVAAAVRGLGLPWIELRPTYTSAADGLYRDSVHLSAQGQRVLGDALHRLVLPLLARLSAGQSNAVARCIGEVQAS